MPLTHNLKQVFIALDQLCNAVIGLLLIPFEKTWADETLSSRAWRWELSGRRMWPRRCIDALFFWDRGHCRESFESERLGRQLPPEARP